MAKDDPPGPHIAETRQQFSAMLRGAAGPTLAVGGVISAIGFVIEPQTGWSAGLGALLVVVFFSLSLLVMRLTSHLSATSVMAVVLAVYTAKIMLLAVALFVLSGMAWVATRALGLTAIVCTMVWLALEMRAFSRLRVLVAGSPPAPAVMDAGQ
ncbi:MAG: hypothetical protein ACRC35_00755 [Angustibacter sp.]